MTGAEDFFAYMSVHWHWLVALIICFIASGAVRDAFTRWSGHRLAMVNAQAQVHAARQPAMLVPPAGQQEARPAKLVECRHYAPNVTAVLNSVTGDREAWYCQACDQQLPATWALDAGGAS